MKTKILFLLLFYSIITAQTEKLVTTGNITLDSRYNFHYMNRDVYLQGDENYQKQEKSPLLAGILSFALPGAGSFYNDEYIKTAVYIGVEVAAITIGLIYDKKGDDQTTFFENFANQHWDVKRYARWTLANASKINPNVDPQEYAVFDINGNVNWDELNKLEGDLGSWYSHRLAHFGEQQYYEMIGKYSQFNVGWEEFGDNENKPFVFGDPLTNQFKYYSEQRGKANDFYDIAKWAVIGVVTNHFISALESAWSANRINKRLKARVSIDKINIGYFVEYYPRLNVSFSF